MYNDANDRSHPIIGLVGTRWLAYVINSTGEQIGAWYSGFEHQLNTSQLTVLASALSKAETVLHQTEFEFGEPGARTLIVRRPEPTIRFGGIDTLAYPDLPLGESVLDNLRREAGGRPIWESEQVETHDPLVGALYDFTLRSWPNFLLSYSLEELPPISSWLASPIGPLETELRQQFRADSHVQKLLPHLARDLEGWRQNSQVCDIYSSDGLECTLNLMMLPSILIGQVICTLKYRQQMVTPKLLHRVIMEVVTRLRQFADGESIQVPEFIALGNIDMSEGLDALAVGSGRLRRASLDETATPFPDGGTNQQRSKAVFETSRPVKLFKIEQRTSGEAINSAYRPTAVPEFLKANRDARAESERRLLHLRAALLLARPNRGEFIAPVVLGTRTFKAVGPGPTTTRMPSLRPAFAPQVVTAELGERIVEWACRLEAQHPTNLDFALKRIVSAAVDREDPSDGLIDAVIGWEALFSNSTQTSLSVTTCLAICCEPTDAAQRVALQKEASNLYNSRSNIVHGKGRIKERELLQWEREATVEYALRALAWIHLKRHDLLEMDASGRSKNLLLTGPHLTSVS